MSKTSLEEKRAFYDNLRPDTKAHRHRFTVPVEWEYAHEINEDDKETARVLSDIIDKYKMWVPYNIKTVTKLKCESCPAIEEVEL